MKHLLWAVICFAVLLLAQPADAGTTSTCTTLVAISCTGTLDTPEDLFLATFILTEVSTITV